MLSPPASRPLARRRVGRALALGLLWLGAACGGARTRGPASGGAGPGGGVTSPAQPAATLLRPGDLIRLRIWREPDLSGEFVVGPDRVVVLPKIGPIRIDDGSGTALERRIVEAYDRYLRNPSIEVAFLRRVAVQGAVGNPGLYTADLTLSVGDVLALAGGVAPDGDPRRVELVRDGVRERVAVDGATSLADLEIRSGDQIYVQREPWLRRNAGVVAGVASSVTALLLVLLTR